MRLPFTNAILNIQKVKKKRLCVLPQEFQKMLDTQDMRYTRVLVATQMLSPCPGYSSKKQMNYHINSLRQVAAV